MTAVGNPDKKTQQEKKTPAHSHSGHRERLRQEFIQGGPDALTDLHILELLLTFSRPRGDVNPMAHELLNTFGSIAGVFDAKLEDLAQVKGVGHHTAVLIKLIPALCKRYMYARTEKSEDGSTVEGLRSIFQPFFFGARNEMTYLACFDSSLKLLGVRKLGEGGPTTSDISVRKLASAALSLHASAVVLAHNHPSGNPSPSDDDIATTRTLKNLLAPLDITLYDHVILTDDSIVSISRYLVDIPRY